MTLATVDKQNLEKAVLRETLPRYPRVMTEDETLDMVLAGRSCARFGDGELRLCFDGTATLQKNNRILSDELRAILRGPTRSLVCIPHYKYGPRVEPWKKYGLKRFVDLMQQDKYGSAFISRSDSQPHIDTPEYWAKVRKLWKGRDIILVVGTDYGSITEHMVRDARSMDVVFCAPRDAYTDISSIEQRIGVPPPDRPIIMCLGPTATCLAERLARKGCWAIDAGHVGRFMPKDLR